ncbi:MAG TPA: phosphotransferase [Anaerolineales bacterium]|nr:phosphotransferase [Anaerolineales bacterium]
MDIKTAYQSDHQKNIETLLNSAGRWLRIFHEKLGNMNMEEGPFFDASIQNAMEKYLETVETTSGLDFSALRKKLDAAQDEFKNTTITHGLLHRDFNCANVLVSNDGRIGVLDFHFGRGPIYIDIAKILTDIQTYSLQSFSQGNFINARLMTRFHQSVLKGYFGDEVLNDKALNFYSVFAILEKWQADEEKLLEGKDKLIIRLLAPFRRNYYMRLASSYAAKL